MNVIWIDGQEYSGPTATDVVRAMKLDDLFHNATAPEAYMEHLGERIARLITNEVRVDCPENFLHDLAALGFIELQL